MQTPGPRRPWRSATLVGLAVVGLSLGVATASVPASAAGLSIRIVGNHFVDGTGRTVRLLGVNRSGSEYACMANWAFFDGPSHAASIAAMASWNIDAVRVPLNEDCWLGINGAPPAFSGAAYRNEIAGYVSRLHAAGMYAIVDLHWNAQGSLPANGKTGQGRKMADLDHAPAYWTSVASFFRNDLGVLFDLFNEPHDISWDCWLNGCNISDGTGSWQAAGMQALVNAVRATGATNVIILSANGWGGDIPQWLKYRPNDQLNQTTVGWHVYSPETWYSDPSKWETSVAPVTRQLPVVVTEFGQHDCAGGWMNQFLPWADQHGMSYTAWTWDAWPDCSNPVLITNYDGTPTGYGASLRDHLRSLSGFHPVASRNGVANQAVHPPAAAPSAVVPMATAAVITAHHLLDPGPRQAVSVGMRRPAPAGVTGVIGLIAVVVLVAGPAMMAGTLWWFRRRRRQAIHASENRLGA